LNLRPGMRSTQWIHGEFLKLFQNLLKGLKNCHGLVRVSLFLVPPEHIINNKYYKLAEDIALKTYSEGIWSYNRRRPGHNGGSQQRVRKRKGKSVGINIDLPFEQRANEYIDPDKLITFDHFFIRKVMFMKYSQGFIVLPGDLVLLMNSLRHLHLFRPRR
jgi:hypothetical protein